MKRPTTFWDVAITVLLVPGLLIVVGLWQLGHLIGRARAWFSKHVLG